MNDPIRHPDRDRGREKNQLNDLQGVFAEIVVGMAVESLGPAVSVTHDLVDVNGPVDRVDLVARDEDGEVLLETKCHLHESYKHLFLINERAHGRSVRRGAHAYVPVLSVLGSSRAYVGRPIGIGQVDCWETSRAFKDPALAQSLVEASRAYFDLSWDRLKVELARSPRVSTSEELDLIVAREQEEFEPTNPDLVALGRLGIAEATRLLSGRAQRHLARHAR